MVIYAGDETLGNFDTELARVVTRALLTDATGAPTYCYRRTNGTLGNTTDITAIPAGAEIELVVTT